MAGRKVLILEMRVRHLPPEQPERRCIHARQSAEARRAREQSKATTDGPTELSAVGRPGFRSCGGCASWRPMKEHLRMTRRERCRSSNAGRAQQDGHWLCNPVDPGSSPGAGPTVV
jgi:hypothetical protein